MQLQEHTTGQVVVVEVKGPIDRESQAPTLLRDKLRSLVEGGHKYLLLNVAELTYVDSVWLGAVVQAYTSALRRGGCIKLLHVTGRFRKLLRVSRLDTVLDIFESEEEATKSFGSLADPKNQP